MNKNKLAEFKEHSQELFSNSMAKLDERTERSTKSMLKRFYIAYLLFGVVGLLLLFQVIQTA